jgi:hypothetical protein
MKIKNKTGELKIYGSLLDGIDFQVVTIHPLVDEIEYKDLITFEDDGSFFSDLYWLFNGVIYFVSIYYNKAVRPKIIFRGKPHTKDRYVFSIVTHRSTIDRVLLQETLSYLSAFLQKATTQDYPEPGKEKVLLDNDIAALMPGKR